VAWDSRLSRSRSHALRVNRMRGFNPSWACAAPIGRAMTVNGASRSAEPISSADAHFTSDNKRAYSSGVARRTAKGAK
jgi:hypothetical protein